MTGIGQYFLFGPSLGPLRGRRPHFLDRSALACGQAIKLGDEAIVLAVDTGYAVGVRRVDRIADLFGADDDVLFCPRSRIDVGSSMTIVEATAVQS